MFSAFGKASAITAVPGNSMLRPKKSSPIMPASSPPTSKRCSNCPALAVTQPERFVPSPSISPPQFSKRILSASFAGCSSFPATLPAVQEKHCWAHCRTTFAPAQRQPIQSGVNGTRQSDFARLAIRSAANARSNHSAQLISQACNIASPRAPSADCRNLPRSSSADRPPRPHTAPKMQTYRTLGRLCGFSTLFASPESIKPRPLVAQDTQQIVRNVQQLTGFTISQPKHLGNTATQRYQISHHSKLLHRQLRTTHTDSQNGAASSNGHGELHGSNPTTSTITR